MKKHLFLCLFLVSLLATFAQQSEPQYLSPDRILVCDELKPFYHGVASGDPLADRVIIWTRVTPDSSVMGSILVSWEMAADTTFSQVLHSGTFMTDTTRDYTVKVDVTGLSENTYYYYRFMALGKSSMIGRTKTLPTSQIDSLRFAVVSCANFSMGYFHSYERIAQRNDVDAIIHLGDYIYEYGDLPLVSDRIHDPSYEILNLMDYRIRHSEYKLDAKLRYAHQQYPFICVWDDHEVANNAWKDGAENHTPGTEGNWGDRKKDAIRAYMEWMPIRLPNPTDTTRIFRTFKYSDLAEFIMLDTRHHGREEQATTTNTDTTRTILGADQLSWLKSELDSVSTQWTFLGQQVMVAPLGAFGLPLNQDQWDGYPAERKKIYDHILNHNIENVVVLTGDIHSSWANDLPYDNSYNANTGANSVGVEFVVTSISSVGVPLNLPLALIQSLNRHVKYANLDKRGYLIVDINRDRVQGEWNFISSTLDSAYTDSLATIWYVNQGERFLRQGTTASTPYSLVNQVQAPILSSNPCYTTGISPNASENLTVFAAYPNPFTENFVVEYHLQRPVKEMSYLITDMNGKLVKTIEVGEKTPGLHLIKIETQDLAAGTYSLSSKVEGRIYSKVVLKVR